eukprot:6898299-Pyramimonas_sp.AAC.1
MPMMTITMTRRMARGRSGRRMGAMGSGSAGRCLFKTRTQHHRMVKKKACARSCEFLTKPW